MALKLTTPLRPKLFATILSFYLFSIPLGAHAQQPILFVELPNAPTSQLPAQSGTITGLITDQDGATVPAARVTLSREGQPPVTTTSGPDGRFSFSGVPSGPFKLVVTASSFASEDVTGNLRSGESLELPAINLPGVTTTASVQVTASQVEIAQAQIRDEEKQRVLGFIPNFYVSYISNPAPLSPKQKMELAYRTTLDPISVGVSALVAGIQQANDTYPKWGQDAPAYGKRFGASYGTFLTGTLLANAVLPIVFRQDPRYFVKGTGTKRARTLYALANAVICRGDNLKWQPNYSSIFGNLAASGIANFYYPAADRDGARLTFENAAIGIGATGIANVIQEFIVRKFTPHLPKSTLRTTPASTTP